MILRKIMEYHQVIFIQDLEKEYGGLADFVVILGRLRLECEQNKIQDVRFVLEKLVEKE